MAEKGKGLPYGKVRQDEHEDEEVLGAVGGDKVEQVPQWYTEVRKKEADELNQKFEDLFSRMYQTFSGGKPQETGTRPKETQLSEQEEREQHEKQRQLRLEDDRHWASYETSEGEDDYIEDVDQLRQRIKCRKKRQEAIERLAKHPEGAGEGARHCGRSFEEAEEEFETRQVHVREVADDDFIQHLIDRSKASWIRNPEHWGPDPYEGYGDKWRDNKKDPPQLAHDATGPQFDKWFRNWRLYIGEAVNGVHPMAIKSFLRAKLEKACTYETWQWIEQNRHESAVEIFEALKKRVFSRTNMAGTFLDILKKRQLDSQELTQLIAENDAMIVHFERAYDSTKEALGILLLMARCKSAHIRQKVAQMQDKPYVEICKVVIDIEKQFKESKRISGHVENSETYETASEFVDDNGTKWITVDSLRGRGGFRGHKTQGRGQNRGGTKSHQQTPNFNRNKSRGRSASQASTSSKWIKDCSFCGKDHQKGSCPAWGKKCNTCNKVGHFSYKCQTNSPGQQQRRGRSTEAKRGPNSKTVEADTLEAGSNMIEVCQDTNEPEVCVGDATRLIKRKKRADNAIKPLELITVTLATMSGEPIDVQALPDTGANINVLPKAIAQRFGTTTSTISSPRCANGSTLKIEGQAMTDLIYNDLLVIDVQWQVANSAKVILSKTLMVAMGLLPKEFPHHVHEAEAKPELKETNKTEETRQIKICNDEDVNAIASKFPRVFCGRVTMMTGEPAKIELTPDAMPTSAGHYRSIADAYLEPLKRELDMQVAAGILEKMEKKPDAANYWLHPIVVVPKKGTKDIRLCVDFRKLNKFCLRPINPQKTPLETVRSLPKGEVWFFAADALKGYHQIPLDENSKLMTAFYTPFGIYMYRSLPMGYAASQDIFTDRFGNAVDDLVAARVTEDCLITASDRQAFLKKIERFFARCEEHGIVLNAKKTQVGQEVIFGGFKLNKDGYSLDPTLHDAIRKFPPPTTLTELRSFMGLINQTTVFTDKIAELAAPLKDLLKKKNEYVWTPDHQAAFEKAREELSNPNQLAYFDHRKPTRLYTDASRLNGLGFVVKQLQDEGHWRIVQAGSRFLSSAETRYAMVELEMLAIAWAMQKARPFLEGIRFEVMTDHKPLIPICNDYALSDIENKRLQRLKMKMSGFRFEAHWIQGKDNVEADALSRAPVHQPTPEDEVDEAEENEELRTSRTALSMLNAVETDEGWEPVTANVEFEVWMIDKMVEEIREAAEKDQNYKIIKTWLNQKYPPPRETIEVQLDPYYRQVNRFSIDESGLLCYDDRLVIPQSLRKRFVDHWTHLHASPEKMISRARKSIWWPFMTAEIKQRWRNCRTCVERSPSKPAESVKARETTQYPFQILHMDIGSYAGLQWLIMIDQFSGWPLVRNLKKDTTTARIKKELLDVFQVYGLPEVIYSDGGPQFASSEFSEFCKEWKIHHTMSSPHYPQSNGIAENGVKAMKKLMHCCFRPEIGNVTDNNDEWTKAIMLYRNTPRKGSKLSPAEILFGRLIRDLVQSPRDHYQAKHKAAIERRFEEVTRSIKQKSEERKPNRGNNIKIGDQVYIQDQVNKRWDRMGVVIERGKNEREFMVRTENGGHLLRNRRFLKLANPNQKGTAPSPTPTKSEEQPGPKRKPGRPEGSRNRQPTGSEPTRKSTRVSRPVVRWSPQTKDKNNVQRAKK